MTYIYSENVANEPVSVKKSTLPSYLLLVSNYWMTLSTILRIMQFEDAYTGLFSKKIAK